MAARRPTAAQQRERRARIAAAVLGAVFLLVCAIQVPRVLHQLHPSNPAPADTAAAAAPANTAEASLLSATGPAAPSVSRLSRFGLKNPFPPPTSTTTTTTAAPAPTPAPTTTVASAPPPAPTPPPTTTAAPTKPLPAPPTLTVPFAQPPTRPGVLVLVGARRVSFARGDRVPAKAPLVRVVGFTRGVLRLRLLTGTLADGSTLLKLRVGRRIVLHDTTDGTALRLEYLRPARLPLRTAPARPAG